MVRSAWLPAGRNRCPAASSLMPSSIGELQFIGGPVQAAVRPSVLAQIGRSLIRLGEQVLLIEVSADGRLRDRRADWWAAGYRDRTR